MSRRIRRQYQAILGGDGSNYYYPWRWMGGAVKVNNAWAALFFYKQFGRRSGVDFHRIQRIVLMGAVETVYQWALTVPGASLKKCQAVVMERGSVEELRAFAQNVPGARRKELEDMAVVKEVLAA